MKIQSGHVRNVQTEWDWKFHFFLKIFAWSKILLKIAFLVYCLRGPDLKFHFL